MLRFSARQTLSLASAALLLTGTLSGCGHFGKPIGASDQSSSGLPTAPDQPADPFAPVDPGADPGTTAPADNPIPAASQAPGAPDSPASAPAAGGFRPLPHPTPTSAAAAPAAGGGADPQKAEQDFINLLQQFGFGPAFADTDQAIEDVRTQLSPELRVPPDRFAWPQSPDVQTVYATRAKAFPTPPSFQQWQQAGLALARRTQNVSFYVARRPLYREIITNRYTDNPPNELTFYKRLNNTGFLVCYGPDGTVLDYGYWPQITWQDFLAVPAAFWN